MADRERALNTAVNLTERAIELIDDLGDRPAAGRYLERALADLRGRPRPSDTRRTPLFLMKMALALIDEQEDETLTGCRLQHAIDTYLREPVPSFDDAVGRDPPALPPPTA